MVGGWTVSWLALCVVDSLVGETVERWVVFLVVLVVGII